MRALHWTLWVPLWAGMTGASGFSGTVTHVTDGDTVWVRTAGNRPMPVRLYGIDAPESCQAGGPEATDALAGRVLHREVEVSTSAHDGYGRTVGTVWLQGEDIGAWLVAQGHAWSPAYRRAHGPYATEERLARTRRRGLFAAEATEPRLFREAHGPCPRPPGKRRPLTGR